MNRNLQGLLSPKSVAIIGASLSPEKVGAIVLKNIVSSGFTGKIYPVNPKTTEISGLKCCPNVPSLPEAVDLAVIAIPADAVNQVLNEIGEKGIKNVIVFSAGFKETGAQGKALEDELVKISAKYELNLLGPNCLGFVNQNCPINATFGQPVKEKGRLRFISQSGALAASLFDFFNAAGIGCTEFITLGNKAVLNENDMLSYFLEQDSKTSQEEITPTGMYLESISNGKEFLRITRELSRKNPIFIIKPGKTQACAKAMQCHTGAIAGEDSVLETALLQSGIIRCKTLEDYFDLSRAFAFEKAPLGPRVAVVSNAGGPAVISADAVVSERLEMVELDEETEKQLHETLPRFASALNPVDVLGDALADRIAKASEIILEKKQAQSLVVILTPQVMTQIEKTAELIGELGKKYNIPIFCSFIGGSLIAEGERKLNECKIPSFRFPERAISAIALMWKWKKWQQKKLTSSSVVAQNSLISEENKNSIKQIVEKAVNAKHSSLDNLDTDRILSLSGIPTPPTQIVSNLDEAKSFVQANKWPVVLKLSSPGLLHKADIGAIVKDISDDDGLATAMINLDHKITQLPSEIREHVVKQIQKDILNGVEVIVGVKRDPTFGPVLLFGAGGTLAELVMDRNLHLLPVDLNSAKEIIEQSKIFKILNGYRGEPQLALDKLRGVILRLTSLIELLPQVTEIEINPLIVTQNDVWAVDGKTTICCEITRSAFLPEFHVAKAAECKNLAGKYYSFTFESEEPLGFKPGQYISIKVSNTRINSYSISDQDAPNRFCLLIDTAPGGPGSKYFENLKIGDKISYLGPFGTFTHQPDDGSNHLLFLGTGSGCSPLRCIIDDLLKVKKIQTPITLYFGLRYTTDVFWKDYFDKLSAEHPNFKFVLVLSKPDKSWQGKSGHITEHIKQNFPDAEDCSVYLCGNKRMIDEVTSILLSNGCPKERIYTEKF